MVPIFIRLKAVSEITGMGKSTIYNLIRKGEFPRPVRVSANISCWLMSEINEWAESRAALRKISADSIYIEDIAA